MKKVIIGTCVWCGILGLVSLLNNLVLLSMHDIEFYYTLDGLKLSGIVAAVEALILVPASKLVFIGLMGKEDFYKVFGEKDEGR